ncbi:MAG: uracil-xanthine permease [Lachnospiraceae bacterium]|nr:uracil-xanthine permease [Lachnospiraceae bacterium]
MAATQTGIYDARKQLGLPQSIILGIQHVFAMFGATVLVPLITGLSVSVTLFCAGIATLWFHFITKGKVPVFLGSSFAFLGAFASIAPGGDPALLPYATGGIVCAGLVYVILAALIYALGAKRVMTLFPPVVTGPIIVLIGLILAPSALNNCLSGTMANPGQPRWIISVIAIAVIIICNIWGKGMVKILPILISIIVSYIVAFALGWTKPLNFSGVVALPPFHFPKFEAGAIVTCVVVALAAIIEHVGDVAAIGATCGKNFIKDPGLTRTLLGDGIGTSIAGLLGGPANTTYSENTGVVALTGVYDPFVLRVAAVVAILLSVIPAVDGFINTIPDEVIGGISFVLYGMISAIGLRTLVEHKVDFANQRNVLIAAIIMVSGLAFNSSPAQFQFGEVTLSFGGLACAAVLGIVLNAILPGKDYVFDEE